MAVSFLPPGFGTPPVGGASTGMPTMEQQLAYLDRFLQTPYGQQWLRANSEAAGYQRDVLGEQVKARQAQNKIERDRLAAQVGQDKANKWYQEQQIQLGWAAKEIEQGRLGLDFLKTDTELRSTPRSWAKLSDWEAGGASNPGVPIYLQRLMRNVAGPAFTAPGGGPHPGSSSAADVAARLTGGTGAVDPRALAAGAVASAMPPSGTVGRSDQDRAALGAIANIYGQGAHKSVTGWDSLDKDDQEHYLGGVARLGGSPDRWQRDIDRARPWSNPALVGAA